MQAAAMSIDGLIVLLVRTFQFDLIDFLLDLSMIGSVLYGLVLCNWLSITATPLTQQHHFPFCPLAFGLSLTVVMSPLFGSEENVVW